MSTHPDLVIALVGKPGTGKTHLAIELADEFNLIYRSVDEIGGRGGSKWIRYTNWIAGQSGVVLTESNVIAERFRLLLRDVEHVVFKLTAPKDLRLERLRKRGENLSSRRRMSKPQIVGYQSDRIFPAGPDQYRELSRAVGQSIEGGRSWL